ncbi:MAG: aldo/keto reductase [Bacteroidales bacterium]
MEYKSFSNGQPVPALGLGTWEMGGRQEPDTSRDHYWIDAIKKAIDLGFRHIDTAEKYGNGNAERLTGHAIKHHPRKDIFLTSKLSARNYRYKDVFRSLNASLERLQTGHLDLYLLHEPPEGTPLEETMQALNEIIDKGLARMAGVSNFEVPLLEEALRHAKSPLVTNQVEYNLLVRNRGKLTRNMESEILPWCHRNGMFITAWRPLAKGRLAKEPPPVVRDVAKKYGKTPAQVALRWILDKKDCITIVKASTEAHMKDDLGALGWKFSQGDMRRLDKAAAGER